MPHTKLTRKLRSTPPMPASRRRQTIEPPPPSNFDQLFQTLRQIDLFGDAPPPVPYPLPPTAQGVLGPILRGAPQLPQVFQDAYVTPLKANLPRIIGGINPQNPGDLQLLETITGAVYERADASIALPLNRFSAVISDLYRSFLSQKRRVAAGFPTIETLPPLAMFQHEGSGGPFTLPCDSIKRQFGATVGVVSLPGVYAQHPLLWGSLCHETGGHDVTHADPGLLPELAQGLTQLFARTPGTDGQLMAGLWSYWIDEATADVYGLLNMGPAFGLNLIAFFAALLAQGQPASAPPSLRTLSGFDPDDPEQLLDVHPTDILRPYLAIGVIQSLSTLSQTAKDAYTAQLVALAQRCAPNATEVALSGFIVDDSGARRHVGQTLPLLEMQLAARQVGAFIASAQLTSLGGHSIQDLETWNDLDEQTALRISTGLQNNATVAGMGDDAQILAGATLAAFAQPSLYQQITQRLNEALDFSFQTDPFWGNPRPHRAFLRFASTTPHPTLDQANSIVLESCAKERPDATLNDTVGDIFPLPTARSIFVNRVVQNTFADGFRLSKAKVPSGDSDTLGTVSAAVVANATAVANA